MVINNMLMNASEYIKALADIKRKIKTARHRAVLAAQSVQIKLFWDIGAVINAHKTWGSKFIDNLAHDIKLEFPDVTGYSVRNLKYMAKFNKTWTDPKIVQTLSAQITWSHNIVLLDKVKDQTKRVWYAAMTIENGWSLAILEHQIDFGLYERQKVADKTTNFKLRLPSPQSELAEQTLKDPYIFDFIEYRNGMIERDIQSEMIKNITQLLLELGAGFAFVGSQYHLEIENEDFYIDLLFYNLKLRCYVVIELKTGSFKPEYAGKLNFYVSAIDGILKTEMDNSTIGILLCKDKRGMIAEYALRDIEKPIGVSEYKLTKKLPKQLQSILPSAEDFEKRIVPNGKTVIKKSKVKRKE